MPILVEVSRAEVDRARGAGGEACGRAKGPGRGRALIAIDADAAIASREVGLAVNGDCVEPTVAVNVRVKDLFFSDGIGLIQDRGRWPSFDD